MLLKIKNNGHPNAYTQYFSSALELFTAIAGVKRPNFKNI
jgi:hypothetical protein